MQGHQRRDDHHAIAGISLSRLIQYRHGKLTRLVQLSLFARIKIPGGRGPRVLPEILSRAGPLKAEFVVDGEVASTSLRRIGMSSKHPPSSR
jgi:hypothetical protein